MRPILIGLAHEFQEVDQLDSAPWDVPLDVIITPKEIIRPQRAQNERKSSLFIDAKSAIFTDLMEKINAKHYST